MKKYCLICVLLLSNLSFVNNSQDEYCEKNNICESKSTRYLFYDVNPPEGFNLRRDVYMRVAVFAHKMATSQNENLRKFKLVLPPWSNLYHWRRNTLPEKIPWSYFFDLESLKKFAPVIEMYEFFQEIGPKYSKIKIDEVYVLQHFEYMFKTGQFEDKMSMESCNSEVTTNFFYYDNITSENIMCLSFHGHASHLSKVLNNSSAKTILFDHMEVALHDSFGDRMYWQARRSMQFNKELVKIANAYRKTFLNSTDEQDNTLRPVDWRDEKPHRTAKGGPYLSVHLRRRDFVYGRPKQIPSIKGASQQIKELLEKLHLSAVFIATDAPNDESKELEKLLKPYFQVFKYVPTPEIEDKYGPGGIAIIEQIICSHARYFIGTHESTFSFRIQEEREILGFAEETTFNRLCGDDRKNKCEKPSRWKIVF